MAWVVGTAIALALGGAWGVRQFPQWFNDRPRAWNYVPVHRGSMEITIKQSGELQSIDNIDINCPVEGQNTIQQIVPEGLFVRKGDVIISLDPTQHRQKLETAEIELEKADADVKWAMEQKAIQEVKNAADLRAAKSDLSLATIDLAQYTEGEFPAARRDLERKLTIAEIGLKRKEEELANSKRLMQGGFLTLSEVQKAELDVITSRNEHEKAMSDLKVLTMYKSAKDLAEKENKKAQAENKVAQVLSENASNLAQKVSDLNTKEKQLSIRKQAATRAREQFENCTIKAPADGMVLYASSVERYAFREQPMQVGAKVMQQQLLIRLPDTSKMKAVAKIPEGKMTRLQIDPNKPIRAEVEIVGLSKPVGATLSKLGVLPDNTQYWMDPDSKNYPVDLTLDETPPGMKPGATASVRIIVDRLTDALAVPAAAIYSAGQDHYVFVRHEPTPKPTKVQIGQSNETMVQIVHGLDVGQDVLLLEAGQGRDLLDMAGIKTKSTIEPAETEDGEKAPPQAPAAALSNAGA